MRYPFLQPLLLVALARVSGLFHPLSSPAADKQAGESAFVYVSDCLQIRKTVKPAMNAYFESKPKSEKHIRIRGENTPIRGDINAQIPKKNKLANPENENNTYFFMHTQGEFYDRPSCLPCMDIRVSEGLECREKGVTLFSLPLAKGYWRANTNTTIIHECLHENACAGGGIVSSANDYCNPGYEGPCECNRSVICKDWSVQHQPDGKKFLFRVRLKTLLYGSLTRNMRFLY